MLGKLIKNDIKSASRSVGYIYMALLIAIGIMGLSLLFDFGVGETFASGALIGISFIAIIFTFIAVFLDFRKTMFGDRGYLTNTLPVSSTSLLFSKTVTSMLWIFISYAVFIGVILGVSAYNLEKELPVGEDFSVSLLLEMFPTLGMPSIEVIRTFFLLNAVKIFFFILVVVLIIFLSVTLSMVRPFQSLGVFGAIITFFILVILVSAAGGGLEGLIDMRILVNSDASLGFTTNMANMAAFEEGGGMSVQMTPLFLQMFLSIFLFLVTSELLEKKVNIK